jgi:hypothetical protein
MRLGMTRALIFIESGDSTSSQVVHNTLAFVCRKRRENKNRDPSHSRKKG